LTAGKLHLLLVVWICRLKFQLPPPIARATHPSAFLVDVHIVAGEFVAMPTMRLVFVPALPVHLNGYCFEMERVAAVANLA